MWFDKGYSSQYPLDEELVAIGVNLLKGQKTFWKWRLGQFPTSSCSGFIVIHLTWVRWSHLSTALRKWHPVSSRWTPKVRKRVTSHKVPRALKREGRFWGISETVMDFSIFKTIEDMISETENFFLHIELLSSLYSDASVPKFNEKLLSWEKHYKHCLL